MLTVRDSRAWELRTDRTDTDLCTVDVVLFLCLFCSQPPVPLFTCQTLHRWNNLWRQEGLYYTDMILLLAPAENQFAARLLHQRVRENKQILISIINQVHMEVLRFFLVDKDKLLVVVVVAEF